MGLKILRQIGWINWEKNDNLNYNNDAARNNTQRMIIIQFKKLCPSNHDNYDNNYDDNCDDNYH